MHNHNIITFKSSLHSLNSLKVVIDRQTGIVRYRAVITAKRRFLLQIYQEQYLMMLNLSENKNSICWSVSIAIHAAGRILGTPGGQMVLVRRPQVVNTPVNAAGQIGLNFGVNRKKLWPPNCPMSNVPYFQYQIYWFCLYLGYLVLAVHWLM